jgi:superfamily I DNA/RNA helicase
MSIVEYSKYQLDFFREMDRGRDNIGLNSVAGSGKSYIAIESVNRIPSIYSAQFCAFGKDIAKTLKPKITRKNSFVNTYNSFGWQVACKNSPQKLIFEEHKTEQILQHQILRAREEDKDSWKKFMQFRAPIKRLVSLLKARCAFKLDDAVRLVPELVDRFRIETPTNYDFMDTVLQTYDACIRNETVYDYDDQIFQPLRKEMLIPAYDFVYVDEYQDSTDIQFMLMSRACRGGRFIGIGDPDQAIYSFRGSTPDIFQKLINSGAKEMFLSICYRCPISVVAEAKIIVPRIEPAPWARQGAVDYITTDDFRRRVAPGDFVLCRTIAPLVKKCLENLADGVPACVLGRQFGEDLEYLIAKVCNDSFMMNVTLFKDLLGEYVQKKIAAYEMMQMQGLAINLKDKQDTIHAFMPNCQTVSDICKRIKQVFTDEGGLRILYMSIHKSKGLECANNVYLIRPDLLPHPRAKGVSWMEEEERRLEYVAITRTKQGFFRVRKEKDEK